jgi:hypothetical protein
MVFLAPATLSDGQGRHDHHDNDHGQYPQPIEQAKNLPHYAWEKDVDHNA